VTEPDLRTLVDDGDVVAVQHYLNTADVPQIVADLGRLSGSRRALAFRVLPKNRALDVFEDLDPEIQRELLDELREQPIGELMEGLDPDDRAVLLEELPARMINRLLTGLDPAERSMTTALLGYPAKSTGRRMTPELVALPQHLTVGAARDRVLAQGHDAETIYLMPIVAAGRRVAGVVSLRRLLVTAADTPLTEVMSDPVMVQATDDQERAAHVVRDNGMLAVPVVDTENRLLGLFTVDDAMRVLEKEEDEDVAFSGATAPLRRPYLSVSVLRLVRVRAPWLLVLLFAAALTVAVQDYFEDTLDQVVTLALFVPLLIGTGGNAGAQCATTVVRAMAVGDVRVRDVPRVVGREMATGALVGTALAVVGFIPVGLFAGWQIAQILAFALVTICVLATTAGAVIPMLARKLGVDPAVVSAPFITTFVDSTGLVVYFLIAQAVLGL